MILSMILTYSYCFTSLFWS